MTGTIIGILMVLPSMVFFTQFPPRHVPAGLTEASPVWKGMELIGQVGCLAALALSKDHFQLAPLTVWAALMLICMLIYYGLWIRYIMQGREHALLWKPFWFIPIPLATFPVGAFGFAALWGGSIWLGVATGFLAIGHLTVSWHSYRQILCVPPFRRAAE